MKIHGFAAFAPQGQLEPFSYEPPPLAPYEILVKISHCGLCHTDLHMVDNAWHRSTYPLLPGHEIVGHIVQKGSLVSHPLHLRVGISWVRSACLACPECLQGHTNICPEKLGIYNHGRFGGFADHVVADSRFAFPIPEPLSSPHAAPLLCAGATVFAPLLEQNIRPTHSIAILGIGGLGHLALSFSRAFGCEVSALSSSKDKEKEAKQLGAHHFYTWKTPPTPQQFDFLLCTVDASLDWNLLLTLLKPNGTLCFVSRPPKGIAFDPAHLVSTQRKIVGSNNASRSVMEEMLHFAARHNIRPLIELMPLSQINTAFAKLKRNEARYRIVLEV